MTGYAIEFAEDDNDTLLVTCEALPEVKTFGEGRHDARSHAVEAIEEALAARIAGGEDIPPFDVESAREPVNFAALPTMTVLKVILYRRLREAGVTRAEFARRLKWNRESVDRLFRLDHRSRLEQIEAAFAALGQQLEVTVRRAA